MTRAALIIFTMAALGFSGCGAVLEEQRLSGAKLTKDQQAFDIEYSSLTLLVASELNAAPFERNVQRGGIGQAAKLVPEASVLGISPPYSTAPIPYRIGVGDELELVIFVTTRSLADQAQESVETRSAKVSADGSVLFIETGKVTLEGKTLEEAREQVANALVRNGIDPRFQLEVKGFNSQKVNLAVVASQESGGNLTVSVESGVKGTGSYAVTERPLTLRELLVTGGLEITRAGVQVVFIDRAGKRYQMPVEHVFAVGSPEYYLTGGDVVRVEQFAYLAEKAFVLGGGAAPTAFEVSPEARQTLADILFVEDGSLATKSARNKEIYLLRGVAPMRAYHLDAQDPSRLRVAAELELRPKDIVFLSSKPIYLVNELISTVNPLAVVANAGQ